MAKSIGATLKLKDGNFFANLKKASKELGTFDSKTSDAIKTLKDFGDGVKEGAKNVLKIGTAVTGAITAIGGFSLKVGTEYTKAANSIVAATGYANKEICNFDGILKDIYSQNYGEGFQDIADSISTVAKNTAVMDPTAIKDMTINAIALRDTFGYDIQEQMRAANMLMDQFGVTGDEAFNLIAQGAQIGLDKNGDLLDTINEYSVHFKQIGIGAKGMFNSLANSAYSGAFSVDKVADALKEFGIRIKAGDGDDALEALGISAYETKIALLNGGEAGEQAFKKVTKALFAMEDPIQQNLFGVQMFGTMWEDNGTKAMEALTDLSSDIDWTYDAMSQIKEIKYNDLGSAFEGIKRNLITNVVLPFSEQLMPAANDFANKLKELANDGTLQSWGQKAADTVVVVVGKIGEAIEFVKEHKTVLASIAGGIAGAVIAFKGLTGIIKIVSSIQKVVTAFKTLKTAVGIGKIILTALSGPVGIAVVAVGALIGVVVALWNTSEKFRNFWKNLWEDIKKIGAKVLDAAKKTATDRLGKIKKAFEDNGGGIKGVVAAGWEIIKGKYTDGFNFINNLTDGKLGELLKKFKEGFSPLIDEIKKGWEKLTGWKDKIFGVESSSEWDFTDTSSSRVVGTLTPSANTGTTVGITPAMLTSWNAEGGIFRKPTVLSTKAGLQGFGEAGAEAVLPLTQFWNNLRKYLTERTINETTTKTNDNKFYITVHADGKSVDEIIDEFVPKLKLKLANL